MNTKSERETNGESPKHFKYESPLTKSVPNIFSRLLFCWMFPIYHNGMSRDLEEYDLVPAKNVYNSKEAGDRLEV